MRVLRIALGWVMGLVLLCWRQTCRYRAVNDPRPRLRELGTPYIYALLHAHQVAAVFVNDEKRLAAMVSRSADGDLLVPSLTLRRVRAARGSTRTEGKDKGGQTALAELSELLLAGIPVLFAVDGPRGPRNQVGRGVATLSQNRRTPILPTLVLPSHRWFLKKTWDRFQIPKPFSTVRLIFGDPILPREGEESEALRRRVSEAMNALEREFDPGEAERVPEPSQVA
jgi:lysophospholipid acyltransferase (LPLAT)-like uncharacterized protein